MRRGNKPKPAGFKILAGIPGGHQRERLPAEPAYPHGWPEMPAWLGPEGVAPTAQEVWEYVTEQMQAAGVVRLIDRELLGGYCDAVAAAIAASIKARTDGSWHAERRQSWTLARMYGALFGIGPAERGRVTAEGKEPDPKARFFG